MNIGVVRGVFDSSEHPWREKKETRIDIPQKIIQPLRKHYREVWLYVCFYVWLCGYVFDYVAMIVIVFICFCLCPFMIDNVVFSNKRSNT